MFGLTFDKIIILALIAAFLLGPKRLPAVASSLGRFARSLRTFTTETTERIRQEVGPEFEEVDWQRLNPRQYDPRRIIREALALQPESNAEVTAQRNGAASGTHSVEAATREIIESSPLDGTARAE